MLNIFLNLKVVNVKFKKITQIIINTFLINSHSFALTARYRQSWASYDLIHYIHDHFLWKDNNSRHIFTGQLSKKKKEIAYMIEKIMNR